MFIELTEFLRCPNPHAEGHLILVPDEMVARQVVRGTVGCPACRTEYLVQDGVVRFGPPPEPGPVPELPGAETLHALLGLTGPGGYVVLVGSAVAAAEALARAIGDVHLVGVNPAGKPESSPRLSVLTATGSIPLRSSMARGVVLGRDYSAPPWRAEAARVLLNGLRLVVLDEDGSSEGVELLARAPGVWVGEKRGRGRAPDAG